MKKAAKPVTAHRRYGTLCLAICRHSHNDRESSQETRERQGRDRDWDEATFFAVRLTAEATRSSPLSTLSCSCFEILFSSNHTSSPPSSEANFTHIFYWLPEPRRSKPSPGCLKSRSGCRPRASSAITLNTLSLPAPLSQPFPSVGFDQPKGVPLVACVASGLRLVKFDQDEILDWCETVSERIISSRYGRVPAGGE